MLVIVFEDVWCVDVVGVEVVVVGLVFGVWVVV